MKKPLEPGIKFEHSFRLTEAKMVPALYPEAPEFQVMPEVFATGFMVGFMEWALSELDHPLSGLAEGTDCRDSCQYEPSWPQRRAGSL